MAVTPTQPATTDAPASRAGAPTEAIAPPAVNDTPAALAALRDHGYAVVPARVLLGGLLAGARADTDAGTAFAALAATWSNLPRDAYLRDGGRYRSRRHGCWTVDPGANRLERAPHRAHWQPTDYNALHGGIERLFEPIEARVADDALFRALLVRLGAWFGAVRRATPWYVEAHQFRIDTIEGIGRPTPEGAHRDGVDFVAVILVNRRDVRGGETRVFDAHGTAGQRFTMSEPGAALLLDDTRVIHETTPIQPAGAAGVRDTLVLTYRAGGFQAPAA
jgi:hypothetical protein